MHSWCRCRVAFQADELPPGTHNCNSSGMVGMVKRRGHQMHCGLCPTSFPLSLPPRLPPSSFQVFQFVIAPLVACQPFAHSYAYSTALLALWLGRHMRHASGWLLAALLVLYAGPLVTLFRSEVRQRCAFAARRAAERRAGTAAPAARARRSRRALLRKPGVLPAAPAPAGQLPHLRLHSMLPN